VRPSSASPSWVGAADVDAHLVALCGGALRGLELRVLLAHRLDARVDVILGRRRARDRHLEPAVALDRDVGAHLDDGVEGDRAVLLALGDVDLGRGDDVDLVLPDGLGVVAGQGLAQGLLARRALAEAGLEHPARCLAGPEPGQADLAGDALEGLVDGALELVRVDLDGQLDLVPLEGLDGASHRSVECSWTGPLGG
jgi:hypothetical protein